MPERVDLRAGYGIALAGQQVLLTPYGEWSLSAADSQRARLGARLEVDRARQTLRLQVFGERDQPAAHHPTYRFGVHGSLLY